MDPKDIDRRRIRAAMTALNGRPLQPDVDAEFVQIVARLRMSEIAAHGSAALGAVHD